MLYYISLFVFVSCTVPIFDVAHPAPVYSGPLGSKLTVYCFTLGRKAHVDCAAEKVGTNSSKRCHLAGGAEKENGTSGRTFVFSHLEQEDLGTYRCRAQLQSNGAQAFAEFEIRILPGKVWPVFTMCVASLTSYLQFIVHWQIMPGSVHQVLQVFSTFGNSQHTGD